MIICKFFTSKLKNYGLKRLIFGTTLEYDGKGYFFWMCGLANMTVMIRARENFVV